MKRRLTDLCLMAMMGTVMVVSQEALAFLPNVELVTSLGLMVGDKRGNFCPRDTANRAQCATVACAVGRLLTN